MYTRFTTRPVASYAMSTPGAWVDLARDVNSTVMKFEYFHHNTTSSVLPEHLLVRLINNMGVPITLSPERYYFNVLENYRGVAEALGLGTDRLGVRWPLLDGMMRLYKGTAVEIGLAFDDAQLADTVNVNWRHARPVQILSHSSVDVMPKILMSADYAQSMPFVVYSVNVPLLMLQFRAWANNEMANSDGKSGRTVESFVRMYPLANAARSHVNMALINAVAYSGVETNTNSQDAANTGVYIQANRLLLRKYATQLNKNLLSVPLSFDGVMVNLLTLDGSAVDSFKIPPVAPMAQTCWPFSIAALHHWDVLARLCGSNTTRMNRSMCTRIKREYALFSTESYWKRELPTKVFDQLMVQKDSLFARLE